MSFQPSTKTHTPPKKIRVRQVKKGGWETSKLGIISCFFFWGGGGAISSCSDVCQVPSLKLKASLHLKIDGWNTRPSFLGVWGLFSG